MSRAKKLIDELILKKANGDKFQESNIRIKLILKGITPDKITENTSDTDDLLNKIFEVAKQFNIVLTS